MDTFRDVKSKRTFIPVTAVCQAEMGKLRAKMRSMSTKKLFLIS